MRSEQAMFDLILNTATADDRIRAVIMNGSRTNPDAPRDIFQDYDVVYVVTDVASFTDDPGWRDRFGERMILQMPHLMGDSPPESEGSFTYLMQFADGNRIDLTLVPIARLHEQEEDSLSVLLLDKDGLLGTFPPASDSDHMPAPPTARAFADCCNEFWWVATYVAKGLWRDELTYARFHLDSIVREELMKMLTWYAGVKTGFTRSSGKYGKYLRRYLEPELWTMLEKTYPDADPEHTWDALETMCQLFRQTAAAVAAAVPGLEYPQGDDDRVSAHLRHVRRLPRNATTMY